jgi:hypothetical protein
VTRSGCVFRGGWESPPIALTDSGGAVDARGAIGVLGVLGAVDAVDVKGVVAGGVAPADAEASSLHPTRPAAAIAMTSAKTARPTGRNNGAMTFPPDHLMMSPGACRLPGH